HRPARSLDTTAPRTAAHPTNLCTTLRRPPAEPTDAPHLTHPVSHCGFDVTDWRGGGGSLALDPSKPLRGRPPLDDEHRGLLVEVGVHDLGDVGVEAVAVRSFGDRSGSDRPAGDLRLARPLRLGALDRVD